jgi:hypothetical protein
VAGGAGAERDVEQHDVVRPPGRRLERRVAVRHRGHAVALALEGAGEHVPQWLVVIDQQDVQRRRRLHGIQASGQRAD